MRSLENYSVEDMVRTSYLTLRHLTDIFFRQSWGQAHSQVRISPYWNKIVTNSSGFVGTFCDVSSNAFGFDHFLQSSS
jgi:hypothetical protein